MKKEEEHPENLINIKETQINELKRFIDRITSTGIYEISDNTNIRNFEIF